MSNPNPTIPMLKNFLAPFRQHLWLWVAPTVVFTAFSTIYAISRPTTWRASQALVVRDEAAADDNRNGRFDSVDMMQTSQETILEVAKNRIVVQQALIQLGPPTDHKPGTSWPGSSDIEELQGKITVRAPQGAEFGRTEVIYLSVTGRTPEQAIKRTEAVCDQLEKHLANLRRAKAQSVIAELEETLSLARVDLEEVTKRLEEMERQVGSDLGELRILNDSGAGDSNLRRAMNEVVSELRQARATNESNLRLRDLLVRAQSDPNELLATPSRLLESQPALSRLKDGLVDAQLRTAELLGKMNERHPTVVAAVQAEAEVRQNLRAELSTALSGAEADLELTQFQISNLEEQQNDLKSRLDRLARLRARYGILVGDLQQRSSAVLVAQQALTDARASQSSAEATSLLTRFQTPEVGDHPVGPRRSLIAGSGLLGGLATGVGLVLLFVPVRNQRGGRRWSDFVTGRRDSDRPAAAARGRRAADVPPRPQAAQPEQASPAQERRVQPRRAVERE